MDPLQNGIDRVKGPLPAQAAEGPADAKSGAAFKALLERLEEETRRLTKASDGVHGARDLAGAVDVARESVEEAIQLGDQLLEAYRAARQRAETGSEEGA
ncbi:MAG: hypothetical protein R3F49_05455 [Planctomycetota bacterium]